MSRSSSSPKLEIKVVLLLCSFHIQHIHYLLNDYMSYTSVKRKLNAPVSEVLIVFCFAKNE